MSITGIKKSKLNSENVDPVPSRMLQVKDTEKKAYEQP